MQTNGNGVDTGAVEPQAAGPFSDTSVSGTCFVGTNLVPSQSAELSSGWITLSAGDVTGTSDASSVTFQIDGGAFSGTYSIDSGGWVTIGGDPTPTSLVSGNKLVKIDPSNSTDQYPMIMIMEK
jgi:hypothetical protein